MTAVLSSAAGPSHSALHGDNGRNIFLASNVSLDSQGSFSGNDEDVTIKMNRNISSGATSSLDELQLLAVSAQITEVTYSISDVQTRIFEIQELRHQSDAQQAPANADGSTSGATGESPTTNIDQALINLDERMEAITTAIASIDSILAPALASKTPTTASASKTPTQATISGDDPTSVLLRKHSALLSEWDTVQEEAETLKGELREDKWLAVFRTVGEQAEAMMMSLEKALSHCQDFIWTFQKNRRALTDDGHSGISSGSMSGDGKIVNYETFQTLLSSYEAKKRYYMPATTKVLSILDRSVRDRVTKNGECLRRHAEARARWKNLRERINRIDAEMETVRLFFVTKDKEPEPSEAGSAISRQTSKSNVTNKSNYLSTSSANRSRTGSSSGTTSAFSRSMSPLKRFASKVTATVRSGGSVGKDSPSISRTTSISGSAVSISNPKPLRPIKVPDPSRSDLAPQQNTSSTISSNGTATSAGGPPRPPPRSPFRPMGNKVPAVSSPGPQEGSTEKKKRESNLFPFLSRPPPSNVLGRSTNRAPSRNSMSGGDTSGSSSSKPKWNSSTRVDDEANSASRNATIRASPQRPSIADQVFRPLTPTETKADGRRSLSRASERERPATSMARHTPWHSLDIGANQTPGRASSRAGARTPSAGWYGTTPRSRPVTPSRVPGPISYTNGARSPSRAASESDDEDGFPTTLMQRAFTPGGDFGRKTPEPKKRRPSNSMIPVPRLNVTSNSRPGTAMSMGYTDRSVSPSLSSGAASGRKSPKESPSAWRPIPGQQESPSDLRRDARAGARSQTPEAMLQARASMTGFLETPSPGEKAIGGSPASYAAPGTRSKFAAPSSFKGEGRTLVFGPGGAGSSNGGARPPSRPGSRTNNYGFGRMTPTIDGGMGAQYVPVKTDELDVEVSRVVNGMPHGFLFERVDPPRKTPAKAGEEVKAQYAVSNALGRKVITCRLVTITKGGAQNKKVMCRVGGGWLELSMYILNRQAGLSS